MSSRAASLVRSLRARRELLLQLTHGPVAAAAPSTLHPAPARHATTRGLVLRGPGGWTPGELMTTARAPAAPLRALRGTGGASLAVAGENSLLLIRAPGQTTTDPRALLRAARRGFAGARAVATGPRVVHAAGMGLAAAITREDRDDDRGLAPASLLRMLSSTKGPQRIGIGWLSSEMRALSAAVVFHGALAGCAYVAWMIPAAWPWLVVCAVLAYATRPDYPSFRMFLHERAPELARRKTEVVDRIRARLAPYMMGMCEPPEVSDYGLFTVISVRDYADYVYVYLGFLSRWILLGWYNASEDYDFDKLRGS